MATTKMPPWGKWLQTNDQDESKEKKTKEQDTNIKH